MHVTKQWASSIVHKVQWIEDSSACQLWVKAPPQELHPRSRLFRPRFWGLAHCRVGNPLSPVPLAAWRHRTNDNINFKVYCNFVVKFSSHLMLHVYCTCGMYTLLILDARQSLAVAHQAIPLAVACRLLLIPQLIGLRASAQHLHFLSEGECPRGNFRLQGEHCPFPSVLCCQQKSSCS